MMRMQFDMTDELTLELLELQGDIDATSKREVFNNAFTLLQWAVRQIKSGRIIAAIDETNGSYTEVAMPIFGNVRKKARQ